MRALLIGSGPGAEALLAQLGREGVAVERPSDDLFPAANGDEVAEIAASLVALEELMTGDRPDAVLVADAGNRALAATLVATKLLVPTLRLEDDSTGAGPEMNRRLIERLADATVHRDAAAISTWLDGRRG
jgi:hypothetical protein